MGGLEEPLVWGGQRVSEGKAKSYTQVFPSQLEAQGDSGLVSGNKVVAAVAR